MCRKMSASGSSADEQQQLGADRVGVLVADLGAEEDDPLAQQALVDVVVEDVHPPPPFIWGLEFWVDRVRRP